LVQDSEARESWIRVQDDEIERLTRERDEWNAQLNPELSRWLIGYPKEWDLRGATAMQSFRKLRQLSSKQRRNNEMGAERDRLRAALIDLEDEVRILLRDNDVEVTEGMSCAIDIAREALGEKHE
jgi:hypothetical protein